MAPDWKAYRIIERRHYRSQSSPVSYWAVTEQMTDVDHVDDDDRPAKLDRMVESAITTAQLTGSVGATQQESITTPDGDSITVASVTVQRITAVVLDQPFGAAPEAPVPVVSR